MLTISPTISIPDNELEFQFVRAQGAGGQHVNKASTAVQLRFDFMASPALPAAYKQRLQKTSDRRINKDGSIVIKAQRFRSQEMNREDALQRLAEIIRAAGVVPKKRRPTMPSKASQVRRLEHKTKVSRTKKLRKPVNNSNY